MPSYAPVYFSRRVRRGISLKQGSLRRRAGVAIPTAVRALATQTKKGPGRPSTGAMSGGTATRTAQGVSTQTGSGSRTVTSTRVSSSKALVKGTPARLQVKSADQMVRANTRTIKQVFQLMNEVDSGHGAIGLHNSISGNRCPLHAFCLTTIDRPNTDLGTHNPWHVMQRDSSFLQVEYPIVFGNQTDPEIGTATALAATGRLVMASARIKLLLWARTAKSTTYDISIIRFKGESQHLAPYLTPEESTSIAGLSVDQLSERKAFWIDHMLRHMTVNPVALTKDGLSRMKKHYEVLYHKEITIDEHLNNDEDENDRHFESINLPVDMLKNFNYSVNSRYDSNTNEERIDQVINTAANDLYDTKQYHKCSLKSNIWLLIKANSATTTSTAGNGGEVITETGYNVGPADPTFDISFECKYKTFSIQ